MMGKGLYRKHLKEKQERQAFLTSLPITRCYTKDGKFVTEQVTWADGTPVRDTVDW